LVENIAFRKDVLKECLTLNTQSFFHKVGLIRILFFTLTTASLPFIVPLLRKFISDQLFLLANKDKECLHTFTDNVIKEVLTEKRITDVIDKVLESVRDHPSNPRVILEGIPLNVIKFFQNVIQNYNVDNFDGRLNTAADILVTFFN